MNAPIDVLRVMEQSVIALKSAGLHEDSILITELRSAIAATSSLIAAACDARHLLPRDAYLVFSDALDDVRG